MSQAPDATAYTAPRKASVPLAQKFSTRVTEMLGSRKAIDADRALLPTMTSSKQVPSQAAWISFLSIPASWMHSWNASTISSSGPSFHRSPNRVHPIPIIATLSFIPLAIAAPYP
jgi:hypothetical protein